MRYFVNKFADYAGGGEQVPLDTSRWIRYISDTVDQIRSGLPPSPHNCDGGLYVGAAGVSYAFFHIGRCEPLSGLRDRVLASAVEYIDAAVAYSGGKRVSRDPPAAFLLGPGGAFVTGSLVYDSVGRSADAASLRQRYIELATMVCKQGDYLGFGSDELFVGRAGYLCGALNLNAVYKQQVVCHC